ncbi:hypothetical protein ABEF95_012014 [Exophiala dermatitidis]
MRAPAAALVDGQLFHECLQSIPIDTQAALDLLHSLEPYVQLQSTLQYLADPPADYPHPAIDILPCLRDLIDKVAGGEYTGEYAFQTDLYSLFLSARDGHFSFIPDLLSVGAFKIPDAALVSVSSDGLQIPRVYLRSDVSGQPLMVELESITVQGSIDLAIQHEAHSQPPSHVVSINGVPTLKYLMSRAGEFPFHDPDAGYNFLFWEAAQVAQFGTAAGEGGFVNLVFYPGPQTSIEYANGSIVHVPTLAEIAISFDNVTDGSSAYTKFCGYKEPQGTTPPAQPPPPSKHEQLPLLPFYPEPVVSDPGRRVAGYFLDAEKNDTAVLSVLSFDVPDEEATGFQTAVSKFLEQCRIEKKIKLIIDVFANGGGIVELGLDLFVQLFPDLEPIALANMRASSVLDDLGTRMSQLKVSDSGSAVGNPFDVHSYLTPDGSAWQDWAHMYSGARSGDREHGQLYRHGNVARRQDEKEVHESSFQRLEEETDNSRLTIVDDHQLNPSNDGRPLTNVFRPNPDILGPPGFHMTPTNKSARPLFDPSNIVLLTDGYCASTCAVFAELLKTQTGGQVRSVVVGGRPIGARTPGNGDWSRDREEDIIDHIPPPPMQYLGATKGHTFWSFESILATARLAGEQAALPSAQRERGCPEERMRQSERSISDTSTDKTNTNHNSSWGLNRNRSSSLMINHFTDLPLRRTFQPDAAGVNGLNQIRVGGDCGHYGRIRGGGDGVGGGSRSDRSNDEGQEEEESTIHGHDTASFPLPLQFVRDDADFRFFFTAEMLESQEKIWRKVAELVF